jgi:hypothetical protein
MKSFKQFVEILDIDTSKDKITFDDFTHDIQHYPFTVNGKQYDIYFKRMSKHDLLPGITNQYEISFVGPEGYMPTNYIIGSPEVCTTLVSAVVKFIQEKQVEAIEFEGTNSKVSRMYQIFANRLNQKYPKHQQFVRIDQYIWIKQDALDHMNPNDRYKIEQMSDMWDKDAYMQELKKGKRQPSLMNKFMQGFLG